MKGTSRWGVVAAFAAVAAVTQMVWLTYAPVSTAAARHYDVSVTAIGWLALPFTLVYVVLAIPAGIALDRGLRRALAAGALLVAGGAAIRVAGDTYALALAGTLLAAVGQPFVVNAVTPIAAGYLDEPDRPLGIALMSAGLFAGMLVAFGLGAALPGPGRVTDLVAIEAAFSLAAVAALLVALRTQPAHRLERAPAGLGAFRVAWDITLVRRLCVFLFLPYGVFIAITTWTESLLNPAGVTDSEVGVLLALQVVAGIIGSALLPVWVTRRRLELRFALVALLVSAAACVALALAPSFLTGLIALPLLGFFALAVLPVVLELTERGSEQAEGTASGLIWLSGNLGGLVVAGVIGFTVDAPALSFLLLAAAVLAALPLARRLRAPVAALAPVAGAPTGPSSPGSSAPGGQARA